MLYLSMVITGFLAGILSGMFGIGGGVIIVPILADRVHRNFEKPSFPFARE